MSRFSKAEAESRGWAFVHEDAGSTVITSATQGRTLTTPPSLRAEKHISGGGTINEEAETLGKLLERIYAYEQHLESKNIVQVPRPLSEPFTGPVDEAGLPQRTVLVSNEAGDTVRLTEEEWANRGHADAIVDEDGFRFTGPNAEASTADLARTLATRKAEDERAAETDVGATEQLTIDETQTAIDNPGGAPQGVVVVQKDAPEQAEEQTDDTPPENRVEEHEDAQTDGGEPA